MDATVTSVIAGMRQAGIRVLLSDPLHFVVLAPPQVLDPFRHVIAEKHAEIHAALVAEARRYGHWFCSECNHVIVLAKPFTDESAVCIDCHNGKLTLNRMAMLWQRAGMTMGMVGLN